MNPKNPKLSISTIAKVAFLAYLFFTFFGTSMPFRDRATSVDEVGTSNIVNQIAFTALFIIGSACLYPKRRQLFQLIKKEKFLTMFIAWCLLSIAWSDYKFVSFKRWFQIISSVTVILSFLLHVDSSHKSISYFKAILYLYIPLTLLSVFVIPGAIDPVHHTWRGLTVGKNYLGQAAVVSIIIWAYSLKRGSLKLKILNFSMLIFSIAILLGSFSMTSILTFVALSFLFALSSIDRFFKPLAIGRTFSAIVILASIVIVISIYYLGSDLMASSFESIGKDMTFTGRTELWIDLLKITKDRLLYGAGYGGFWVIRYDNPDLMVLYQKYVWLPNETHLGYLDILIDTGFVGLSFFFLMVLRYFKNLIELKKSPLGLWLLIAALTLNLQESTLFFTRVLTGELFLFAYLALYAESIKIDESLSPANQIEPAPFSHN